MTLGLANDETLDKNLQPVRPVKETTLWEKLPAVSGSSSSPRESTPRFQLCLLDERSENVAISEYD